MPGRLQLGDATYTQIGPYTAKSRGARSPESGARIFDISFASKVGEKPGAKGSGYACCILVEPSSRVCGILRPQGISCLRRECRH
ncbi:hypothetical protein E4U43_006802 [Claviceps pusilla]|uniref:Uncharacterized protein n=1 Tax=Claviceps pusilla TaxID=123648 RepID=A0A9P7T223_9HYPO|nr:hypothetical protein E4U43_006802 [Claviceps pusilla]